jgi:endonuclease YncB( thermonuclease family)
MFHGFDDGRQIGHRGRRSGATAPGEPPRGFGGGASVDVQRFGSCRNEAGPNCVLDGDTIRIDGEQVIAGMAAPKVEAAHCDAEERGAKAVDQLLRLLNSGKVTSSRAIRGADGVSRRMVQVDGRDLAAAMIAAGVARNDDGEKHNWCS